MPIGWPPRGGVVGEHLRRFLVWYVLGSSVLTLAGVGWTIVEVRALRQERGAAERAIAHEETR